MRQKQINHALEGLQERIDKIARKYQMKCLFNRSPSGFEKLGYSFNMLQGWFTFFPIRKGKYAIIDTEDLEKVSKWKWHFLKATKRVGGYARTKFHKNGFAFRLSMHHLVINKEKHGAAEIDHINGNGLDNRKANLRYVTKVENQRNRGIPSNNTSGYKGVSREPRTNKWRAHITVNNHQIRLGSYETKEEAAKAYNIAAKKYFGELAWINPLPFKKQSWSKENPNHY